MKSKTHPIRSARQKAGLSQQALAEAIGSTKGAISGWEVGRCYPRAEKARVLVKTLPGLTLDQIYGKAA